MGEKLISFLVSTRLTAILFIVFALAMAIGTFIENDYGTVTAKILIYNATSVSYTHLTLPTKRIV